MKSKRIGFSKWCENDINFGIELWGDKEVTKYISKTGVFTHEEIKERLQTEIQNDALFHVQYWPLFDLETQEFIGCCGIRPNCPKKRYFELGFHICKKYWGKGYAFEAAQKTIEYSFDTLKVRRLLVGHHPANNASQKLIEKLGFLYVEDFYYEPTGLYHPSYQLEKGVSE